LTKSRQIILLSATFLIAVSGLIYELLAASLSSYLQGDSVYQFSLVIGLFMTAMGLGAYLSRFVHNHVLSMFVQVQLWLGLFGGLSAPILFFAFVYIDNYSPVLWLLCLVNGSLIGLEIPLLMRILKQGQALKQTLSNVLTADYIGALFAALLFPLVLVPQLGLMSSSLAFGLLNILVALATARIFLSPQQQSTLFRVGLLLIMLLGTMLYYSQSLVSLFEQKLYRDPILLTETTPYQRLVLTRKQQHTRLYINGNLQFDSMDEYRYHEALVHPAMGLVPRAKQVLVLGGGDGLAVREILKHPHVKHITLVDLDPRMTELFSHNALLTNLNKHALQDPKVSIINQDAWLFLKQNQQRYQVIFIDLPDPHHINLSKLYSRGFYQQLGQHLSLDGVMVTQATSPLFSREAFWCIAHTLDDTPSDFFADQSLYTRPYHSYVPSFGEWGFVLAAHHRPDWQRIQLIDDLQFLTPALLSSLIIFPEDMAEVDTDINTLQDHPLLRYYQAGWEKWFP